LASPDAVRAALSGYSVEAEGTRAEGDDVKKPAGHHQILIEIDHIGLISGRQMHAKSSAEADKSKQSSGPSGVETCKQRQAAEQITNIEIQTATSGAGT
jgi:hypothetical protein